MKKAISIEQTERNLAMVYSIAPPEFAPEFNGVRYFLVEDYEEPENTDNMTKAYPFYDKEKKKFLYLYENYYETMNMYKVTLESMKSEMAKLVEDAKKIKEEQQKAIVELTNMILAISASSPSSPSMLNIPMPPLNGESENEKQS